MQTTTFSHAKCYKEGNIHDFLLSSFRALTTAQHIHEKKNSIHVAAALPRCSAKNKEYITQGELP
jgi:hypothetical protein